MTRSEHSVTNVTAHGVCLLQWVCHGNESESARFFARRWRLRGLAGVAVAVAAVGASGRGGSGERCRCGGRGCTVADGVCHDSQWRESGSMVAEGRRQGISACADDGAAGGTQRPDSGHRGIGPHQRHGRDQTGRRSCAGECVAADRLPGEEDGRVPIFVSVHRSIRWRPSKSAISLAFRRSN